MSYLPHNRLKIVYTAFLVFCFTILWVHQLRASWLIDAAKYHVSAHGQNSCLDCHSDIPEREIHPDPLHVNRSLGDFFEADNCLACHDEVFKNLEAGVHGSQNIEDRTTYEHCIDCHNPHYQARLGEGQGRVDSSLPLYNQCGVCHKEKTSLPEFANEDEACMTCHGSLDLQDDADKQRLSQLCFHCHGQGETQAKQITEDIKPLINIHEYQSVPHAGVACTICHPQAVSFGHGDQRQGECSQCHLPHDEKVAHDAHIAVACEACHLDGVEPVRDPDSKAILWNITYEKGESSKIHHMRIVEDENRCERCHFKGNNVGAVSMILPAKSILCMPCHAGTFSVGDPVTIIALILFLTGIVTGLLYWFSGSVDGDKNAHFITKLITIIHSLIKNIFSSRILVIIQALALDVFLQRRLFIQSFGRWLIHSLIFFPFLFRFAWGLLALVGSVWKPEWHVVWPMLNKNSPATAFLFDLTGFMIAIGVVLAFFRGRYSEKHKVSGLPRHDNLALGLIFAIIVVGFILEGMRISMTGIPPDAGYSFVGYIISRMFSSSTTLSSLYGYLWYVHAICTGIFIAYLPFSRLMHVILSPIVLSMNAIQGHQ
jgi:nitrate reductase gamma subunit